MNKYNNVYQFIFNVFLKLFYKTQKTENIKHTQNNRACMFCLCHNDNHSHPKSLFLLSFFNIGIIKEIKDTHTRYPKDK